MLPIFANLFAVSSNEHVTQIVFRNQLEKDGPTTESAHVALSRSDAIALAKVLLTLVEGEGNA